jgi:uncharacterized RDD family membrane protein YckC
MNPPPGPPDPNDLTQPIPVVQPPPARPNAAQPRGVYVHRFGNLPWYFFARFGALAIDLLAIPFVLMAFGFNAFDRGLQTFAGRDQTGLLALGAGALAIGLLLAYLCEALTGTTLGKLTFGLHTRRLDGGHAGGGRVLLRYLLLPIDVVLIGPLLAVVTRRHQRLGDLAARTIVSGSRLRGFAPVLGIALLAALGYAQVAYGGGLTSAIEVAAETSNVVPGFVSKGAQFAGLGTVSIPSLPFHVLPSSSPSPSLSPSPSASPASPAPTASPALTSSPAPAESAAPDAPSDAPSDTTNVARPGYPTDPPDESATADPDATPTDGVVTQ